MFIRLALMAIFMAAVATATTAADAKPAATDMDTLLKQLGDDEFSVRETTSKALVKLGEKARKAVEKVLKETQDADVRARADTILRVMAVPRDFAALDADEREIAQLPFSTTVAVDGKQVSFRNYGRGNDYIGDFGNVRVVIEDQPFGGESTGAISIGGGTAAARVGSFKVTSKPNGDVDIDFRGITWSVVGKVMKIAGQETGFGGGTNRVIFLDKTGKFKKRVDMPQKSHNDKK